MRRKFTLILQIRLYNLPSSSLAVKFLRAPFISNHQDLGISLYLPSPTCHHILSARIRARAGVSIHTSEYMPAYSANSHCIGRGGMPAVYPSTRSRSPYNRKAFSRCNEGLRFPSRRPSQPTPCSPRAFCGFKPRV
jgi:hypothetical protein